MPKRSDENACSKIPAPAGKVLSACFKINYNRNRG